MSFIKDFLLLDLNQFENFGIYFPIGAVFSLMALAFSVAVFISNYHKRYTTQLLRQLIRHKAFDEDSAKTLNALRVDKLLGLKSALTRNGQLTYMVRRVGETKQTYEEYVAMSKKRGHKDEKIDFDDARFHIDPQRIDRAKRLVETTNAEWWRPAIMALVIIAIWVVAALFLPDLLEALNEIAAAD